MTVTAWLPFTGGTAEDATGNGHDGVIHGSPSSIPGLVGDALLLDGNQDRVVVANHANLQTADVTLGIWCRADQLAATGSVLIEKSDGVRGYRISVTGSDRQLRFEVFDAKNTSDVSAEFSLFPSVWTSIVAAYQAGGYLRLYVDAALVGEVTPPLIDIVNDADIVIGSASKESAFYAGAIDEVIIGVGLDGDDGLCTAALKVWDASGQRCLDPMIEVAASLGVDDTEHRHFGTCMVDVNQDGWIDLYYANGAGDPAFDGLPPDGECVSLDPPPEFREGSANTFYLNQGDGTFGPDIAVETGFADEWNAMRHVFADYDNDGLRDLISHNFILSTLYRAIGADPLQYEDASAAAELQICIRNGTGASWVDLNHDGFLDIYAVEYRENVPPEDQVNPMYINDGDGTFTEITQQAGVDLPNNPMGIAFADYDNDGDQDVFVTNSAPAPSRLFQHQGVESNEDLPFFVDVAAEAGVALDDENGKGIGTAWGDYNNDGRLDLLFVRESDTRLFRNDGPNESDVWTFTDVTNTLGIPVADHLFWGGNFADLNNDGLLDLVLTDRRTAGTGNVVLFNDGDDMWHEAASVLGMALPAEQGLGFVAGDIDNDGDVDAALVNHTFGRPNYLFRNDTRGNNWVQFRLTGATSNRDAIGARITIQARMQPNGPLVTQMREVVGGTGFFSDFPRIQTFGLGKAGNVVSAVIRWPSGRIDEVGPLSANQRYDFLEPRRGDFDADGSISLDDLAILVDCMAGPGEDPDPTPPLSEDQCLGVFDFNHDGDVDLDDALDWTIGFDG